MELHDDGYEGTAILVDAAREVAVNAVLRGFFQPITGRYQWYGRLSAPSGELDAWHDKRSTAVLTTSWGPARCEVYEPDPWGRLKVTGTGVPPFEVGHAHPALPED